MFSKGKLALWANDCGKRFLRIMWDYVWGVIFWVQKPQKLGIKTDQLIKMQRGTCFCSLRIFLSRRIKGKSREGKKIGGQREKDIPLMKNISLPFPQVLPRKYVFIGVKVKWYYTELQFYRPLKWRINVRKSASYLPATSFSNVSSCLLPTNIFCNRCSWDRETTERFPYSREFIQQTKQSKQLWQIKAPFRSVWPLETHSR